MISSNANVSLSILIDYFVYFFEAFFYHFLTFGPSDYNFTRNKDKKSNFRVLHSIDKTWKDLRLVLNLILFGTLIIHSIRDRIIGKLKFI